MDPPSRPPPGEPLRPEPPPVPEPTAADVAGAPVPGQESGRVDRAGDGDSPPRLILRGILFLPKVAVQAALAPVRGGIWANERYRLTERAYSLFFNDAGTMGLYPTVGLQSGFGATVGARFVHRDLFGAREHVSLSAATGGRFRQVYGASFRTGDRLGEHLRLGLRGEHDRRPKEVFYGIGNRDEVDPMAAPLDALAGSTGVETRFRQQLSRATAIADVRVAGDLHLIGAGALTDVEVARSDDGPPIDEVYMPASLPGWGGARHAYGELEVRWDSLRSVSVWDRPVPSGGWLAGAYGGRVHRLDGGPDFWRYGAHAHRLWRIGLGPRVIAARAHVEAVSGARDEVPFFELPALGGSQLLRGYPTERFRDRIAAVGSLDYGWDVSQRLSARVFTDVGRVYASADDLGLGGLRVGYGLGLDAYSKSSFVLRTSVASSIDGGVELSLSFSPVFDVDTRVERR